ncbi:MAG: hypothetical protein RRB18_05275 [Sulfolobaceae archaeon]|jgi:hypothetical protein|nr:hypothetical protein [Sulfolobaceae archaeon]
MPYVDKNDKICRPGEKSKIEIGDIILVHPALLKIRGYIIEFPPLSIISPSCKEEIESPNWVEGYTVTGKEKVLFLEGKKEIEGEIEVKCPRFLPAITLKHALGKVKLKINDERFDGIVLVGIGELPILLLKAGQVTVTTTQLKNYLEPLAYSVYYYISSENNESS